MFAASDPGSLGFVGEVGSRDSGVCIRAHEPEAYDDQPHGLGRSTLCGPVAPDVDAEVSPGMCVDAAYDNFPPDDEEPPEGKVSWIDFNERSCP